MAISGASSKSSKQKQDKKDVIKKKLTGNNHIDTRVVVDINSPIIMTKRYIDGSDWTVTYYNQISTNSDTIGGLDTHIANVEQQYEKISKLVLKVTSPIESTTMTDITGEAVIMDFTPSIGDSFVASLIGDIKAKFSIIEISEKSYNLDRVFDISFKLDTTYSIDPNAFKVLEDRVVREYIYDNNSIYTTSDTLLLKSDYEFKDYITRKFDTITRHYKNKFTDQSLRNLLILKHNNLGYHDSVIAYLFNNISDRSFQTEYIGDDLYKGTIVDILLEDSKEYLPMAKHTGYDTINSGGGYDLRYRTIIGLPINYAVSEIGIKTISNTSTTLPIDISDTYLFTRDFYDSKDKLCLIEELLTDILDGKILNKESVSKLLKDSFNYANNEQYHYIPFVLLILKYTIRTMHSKG